MTTKYRISRSERRKQNRRSMRRRIKKVMVLNSMITLIVMSTLVLMVIFGAIGSIGALFADVVAGDIVQELENPRNKVALSDMSKEEMMIDDAALQKWFHSIGNKFYFDMSEGFHQRSDEEFDAMVGVMNDNSMEMTFSEEESFMEFSLVYVEITYDDEIVFSTLPEDALTSTDFKNAMKHYESESVQSYYNVDGEQLGEVCVRFNAMLLVGITVAFVGLFVLAAIVSTIISIIISIISSGAITKSLADLQRKMRNLSEGEIEKALHSELEIKKPFSEIEDLAASTNSIIEQMRAYSESIENHKVELEAQNVELVAQGTELSEINHKLEAVNVQMKDILDNVGQGFLRFGRDLMIHAEYSKECRMIFDYCVANKKLSSLVYPNDDQQAEFVDDLLIKILDSDEESAKLYIPLLPDEVKVGSRVIHISYKISDSKTAMIAILTDITEKRELIHKMDEERQILKMVVKSMVNRRLFVDLTEHFEQFIFEGNACNWTFKEDSSENIKFIMRQLHTFKGNFSQFDVMALTTALHNAETELYKQLENVQNEAFEMTSEIKTMLQTAYDQDMDIIRAYVGGEYFIQDERFVIEKSRILEIERKMQSVLSEQECKILLPDVRGLRYKPIKEMLKMYPEYTLKLAERLDKTIETFTVQADEIRVDEDRYNALTSALVHIFRNAVDHGIETPDDRVEAGKDIVGKIACVVTDIGKAFEITITDDGAGISPRDLREQLKGTGYSEEEVAQMDDKAVLNTVFDDSVTTQQEATILSGRGSGLAAVRKAVEDLKGTITLQSVLGKGSTFTIRIPYTVEDEMRALKAETFLEALAGTTENYINTRVNGYTEVQAQALRKTNRIDLESMTALVNLKGIINALIMISVNIPFGEKLAKSFLLDPVPENELESYIEDVLAEIANTLLGNTLGHFDDGHDFLHMGIPAIISNKGAYVKYSETEILTCDFKFADNYMSIHMIRLEGDAFEEATLWQEY